MSNLYKGLTLNDTVDFAKKLAHFFIKHFKSHVKEAIQEKNDCAIKDYLDLAHLYLQSLSEVI